MNHYPRHIGDWMRDTAHLSEIEECIYSRLIDQYYSRERPLPANDVQCCRLVRAVSKEAKQAVGTVLEEFFALQNDGWHQKRCDAELENFRYRVEMARLAGVASANKKAQRNKESAATDVQRTFNARSTDVQRNGNGKINSGATEWQLPITHNPVPITQGSSSSLVSPPAQPHSDKPKKNGKSPKPVGSRLSANWRIPDDWIDWTLEAYPSLERPAVVRLSLEFRDYWCAVPGQKGLKSDWLATWRNRCRQRLENHA